MPYYERIKADFNIFEKMMFLDVSERLRLFPIRNAKTEGSYYLETSNTADIKKYLPGAFVSDEKQAMQKLVENIQRALVLQGIFYNLTIVPDNIIIGHILLHSPLAATNLGEWSIDFWIREDFRNNGIMTSAVHRTLLYMQQLQIKNVAATVDRDNLSSRKVLEKIGFGVIGDEDKNRQLLYGLSL